MQFSLNFSTMSGDAIPSMALAILAISSLAGPVSAHSWPERAINVQGDGFTPIGNPGYQRNTVARGAGFQDSDMTNRIIQVDDGTDFCMTPGQHDALSDQSQRAQSANFPRLQTSPNSRVAIQYLENGHVSNPQQPPGHDDHSGTVWVFGSTTEINPKLVDVIAWNQAGNGGNGKGVLLASQSFDDGQCYQAGPQTDKGKQRAAEHPVDPANPPIPGIGDLPCHIDFDIPADAPTGQPYSIFWYWDWTMVANANDNAHREIYTSCMDFDIVGQAAKRSAVEGRVPMSPSLLHHQRR